MNSHVNFVGVLIRRIAEHVVAHAERALGARHRDWGRAMRAELDHIDGSLRALRWSLGCVAASYQERFRVMNRTHVQISSWLFGIEALVCLGPLTLLWCVAVLNLSRLSGEPNVVWSTLFATIAPIGLLLALRFSAAGKVPSRKVTYSLTAAFLVLGLLQIAGMAREAASAGTFWFGFEWKLVVLFSVLPAVCCWHLSMQESRLPTA